jgi:hypothetical protein
MTCVLEGLTWKNIDTKYYLRQKSQRISDKEFHYNIVETRVSAIEYAKDQLQ